MHIRNICREGNESSPPVLEIIIFGVVCIISGLYFAFFSSGVFSPASRPLHLSPYDLFGNLLILAGIILLLIGSYRQKNSPVY